MRRLEHEEPARPNYRVRPTYLPVRNPAAAAAEVAADEGNKKRSPPSVSSGGSEHMIFKNKETGDVCTGTDDGRVADSLLDRYRRFVGFAKDGDEEDRLEGDQYMQQMVSELRVDGAGMIKSFDQVATRVAQFERFIQKFHLKTLLPSSCCLSVWMASQLRR